jgi:hypothetical protein
MVVDQGSLHGTYVRGARVGRHPIPSGERIALGGPAGPELSVELLGPVGARPDDDGRVDLATAQQLVASAVAQNRRPERPTALVVAQKVQAATRGGRRWLKLLTLLAFASILALFAAIVYVYRSNQAADILASEVGLGKKAAALEGEVPTEVLTGREIHQRNKDALFVMAYLRGNRIGGCCSAFAISATTLATNAHCILACEEKGGDLIVVQNESAGKVRFEVTSTEMHPRYEHDEKRSSSPDVGLLAISGKLPSKVRLANDAELRSIGPGDDIFVLGFPGRVMDPTSPSATFLQGSVGRTTDLDGETSSAAESVLLQHDAVTRGGNSGSPIFNQYGNVIAIHTAHIDDEDEVSIDGKKVTVVQSSPFRVGMRIDLLGGVPKP